MNSKIKKYAQQAGFVFYDMHNVDGEDLGEQVESDSWSSVQAFADLIIGDCISFLETHEIPVGNSAAGEMSCRWTHDALLQVRAEIVEHFLYGSTLES